MRVYSLFAALLLVFAAILNGCNSAENTNKKVAETATKKATPAPVPPSDDARRITVAETQDLLAKGQAVIIDVRSQGAYDQGHIKGAKLIPVNEIQQHLAELPHDKTIVTYCS